ESVVEGTVAAFVFITSFLSAKTSFHPKKWHWIAVGFLASFLGMIVAVTGPFVSIFFNQGNLSKEEQLVTKSVCHALTQVVKIVFFSFSLEMEADEMVVGLIVATLIGTFIGTKLLRYFSEKQYRQITHWLLRLIALSMLLKQFFR
ncbi:MAG: sulfite exporter TauE/SafE family protein, partial [Flammeovirgaceae bacterium]|nr:sulfite exporter TauE/SafE family protein [Flammeovirgaceae bacterium]